MDDTDYRNAIQALAQLAHAVGTNGKEQHALITAMHEIEMADRDSMHNQQRVRQIVAMFYDGLAYGNWPWIVNGVNTLKPVKVSE